MNRRTFLRGAGAAIALPWLESLAHAQAPIQRLVVFYVPNGIPRADWIPSATGRDFPLPPALLPLAPIRENVLVLSGLANASAIARPMPRDAPVTSAVRPAMPGNFGNDDELIQPRREATRRGIIPANDDARPQPPLRRAMRRRRRRDARPRRRDRLRTRP